MGPEGGEWASDLLLIWEKQTEGIWGVSKHSQSRPGHGFISVHFVTICWFVW